MRAHTPAEGDAAGAERDAADDADADVALAASWVGAAGEGRIDTGSPEGPVRETPTSKATCAFFRSSSPMLWDLFMSIGREGEEGMIKS